jgi:hypothetical protein
MKLKTLILILTITLLVSTLVDCEEKKKDDSGLEPIVIPKDQYDDNGEKMIPKTEKVLREEHKKCNRVATFGQEDCIRTPECCYFESYETLYDEHTPKCVSLDAYVRYTIRNPIKYMKDVGVSNFHNRISMNTFCEIIDYDTKIPKVRNCRCKMSQKARLSKILAVGVSGIAVLLTWVSFA